MSIMLVATACGSDGDATSAAGDSSSSPTTSAIATDASDGDPTTTALPTTEAPATTAAATTAPPASTATPEEQLGDCSVPGVSNITIVADGGERDVRVFVPESWDGSELLPMVVNWHGLGGNGPQQAGFSNYEALAATEDFIVVHPSGVAGLGGQTSWELSQFPDPSKDDVAYANALLDTMIETYCADPARIYSTGMSNGGLFTSVLLCEMADRIAAAASVAGVTHDDSCEPSRAVPYIAFHGTADGVVSFDGDSSGGALFAENMPAEFGEFAADFGCDAEPASTDVSDQVIRYDYAGCDDSVPMSFYEITGGGHTWPSSPLGALVLDTLGVTTTDVDATADAWAFFKQHSL